ncbi:MAG: peroxide stress protein YaaA [Chlamydiales bacterium]|nr:peroxide stress protein YaaA [Chlamydiales bacterium]
MFHIVLSPSKTLDFESETPSAALQEPLLLKKSKKLADTLKKHSVEELMKLMGISEKLALLNHSRFQTFKIPFPRGESKSCLFAFQGDVYTGLDASSLNKTQLNYADNHLSILSGFYGLLRPLDHILPYRLEMGCPLKNEKGKNLYEFWDLEIQKALKARMDSSKDKVLVNLASEEYFKSIAPKSFPLEIIECKFKNLRKDKYKVISFIAKKARGKMARFIIKNRPTKIEEFYEFKDDGYRFIRKESDDKTLVFHSRQ